MKQSARFRAHEDGWKDSVDFCGLEDWGLSLGRYNPSQSTAEPREISDVNVSGGARICRETLRSTTVGREDTVHRCEGQSVLLRHYTILTYQSEDFEYEERTVQAPRPRSPALYVRAPLTDPLTGQASLNPFQLSPEPSRNS